MSDGNALGLDARWPQYHRGIMTKVYKIVAADTWRAAEASGVFTGAGVDIDDGFIHLSTGEQVMRTAQRFFAGCNDLLLVEVDVASLGATLRYEPSSRGELFPHIHGALPMTSVVSARPLPLADDGTHAFPDDLM